MSIPPNGLRYLRWGIGAIRFGVEKNSTAEKMLGMPQNPQRQVHALLGNLPAYQNLCPKKITPPTRPNFTPDFIFDQNQNYDLPKRLPKK